MRLFHISTGLSFFLTLFAGIFASAQIISPSGVEVKYDYTATFQIPINNDYETDEERAEFHASHLFGLFHTPRLIQKYHVPGEAPGGIGGPRAQMKIKILSSEEADAGSLTITYRNTGKMILYKKAAAALLEKGYLDLPMPSDPYAIYNIKCTDPHYTDFGDYWYFYDAFRPGCEHLSKAPYATNVRIQIEPLNYKKMDLTPKLPMLRGDNGNGDLFSIYVIHGYAESATDPTDDGRIGFYQLENSLTKIGFKEGKKVANGTMRLHNYAKTIELANGKSLQVEIKQLLIDTEIGTKSKTFAQFFKEGVETADVVIYGGHSGLGGNLDIPSLEAKVGKFQFDPNKKQLFFFDSCSSYSYYLEHFTAEKTKAKIDVITNGLSSYFDSSNAVMMTLMGYLFSPETEDVTWEEILGAMEKKLGKDTYLLNVGGV